MCCYNWSILTLSFFHVSSGGISHDSKPKKKPPTKPPQPHPPKETPKKPTPENTQNNCSLTGYNFYQTQYFCLCGRKVYQSCMCFPKQINITVLAVAIIKHLMVHKQFKQIMCHEIEVKCLKKPKNQNKQKTTLKSMNLVFGSISQVQLMKLDQENELSVHDQSCSRLLNSLQDQKEVGVVDEEL